MNDDIYSFMKDMVDYTKYAREEKPEATGRIEITRVRVYNNKVVVVWFNDGTHTKAVCSDNDHFDLDAGVAICVVKRYLMNDGHGGTKHFNEMIRAVHKMMDIEELNKQKAKEEKAEVMRKEKARAEKKRAKIEAEREALIGDMTEAITRALGSGEKHVEE